MRKTTATVVALATCMSVQLFAQNTKEDTITFALTTRGQTSVSQTTSPNSGTWINPASPYYYKTTSAKMTQVEIIKAIGAVLKRGYSSSAKLVLVQGELSGFFNLNDPLAASTANRTVPTPGSPTVLDGTFTSLTGDAETSIGNSTRSAYVQLATGRHFDPNPITGAYPPGHHQPWGQVFVKDKVGSTLICDNVTYFFSFTVQECYDCFYLNSFVTDSTFKSKTGAQNGPPCCNVDSSLLGNGKDQYYMTMTFDNTPNNPYLNPTSAVYTGHLGLVPPAPFGALDGSTPDSLAYANQIASGLGRPSPYLTRFTLNGIVAYTWSLKFLNSSDIMPDFIGTASYSANGYGFIGLVCQLLTGTATFTEKAAAASGCCLDVPWNNSWYGTGDVPNAAPTPLNREADLTQHDTHGAY